MTADFVVVDASALAAVAFGEPEGEALRQQFGVGRFIAPTLLPYELGSIACKKIRREPAREAALSGCLRDALSLPVQLLEVPPPAVTALALQRQLTAYDASYLWLALRFGARLLTLDARLQRAAALLH